MLIGEPDIVKAEVSIIAYHDVIKGLSMALYSGKEETPRKTGRFLTWDQLPAWE
jgi:hypothetical protein